MMKRSTSPTSTNASTIVAVFMAGRHNTVKHWRNSAQTNTLCEQPVIGEQHPTGISRECLVCSRLKTEYDAARRSEFVREK